MVNFAKWHRPLFVPKLLFGPPLTRPRKGARRIIGQIRDYAESHGAIREGHLH